MECVERGGKAERGGREKEERKIHREQDRQIGVGMTTNTSGEREREIQAGDGRQNPHMPGGTRDCGEILWTGRSCA